MKSDNVTVPYDLYEWLVEYAMDLQGEWNWRRNSSPKNNHTMAQLDEHIFQAIQIREKAKTK